MRCNSCNKFVSNEEMDPEAELDLQDETVTASVRIVNACAECNEELTEATFDLEEDISEQLKAHKCPKGDAPDDASFSVTDDGTERTSRSGNFKKGVFVPAMGRYAKTFYGFSTEWSVKCDACDEQIAEGTFAEDVQASAMEPLN